MIYHKLSHIDAYDMRDEIAHSLLMKPDLWDSGRGRAKNVIVQSETESIWLRSPKRTDLKIATYDYFDSEYREGNCKYFPRVVKFLEDFTRLYGGTLGNAMLVKMKKSARVYPHIDNGWYYRISDRFHLAITGEYDYFINKDIYCDISKDFWNGVQTQRFKENELWYFDNQKYHASECISEERISLIFDVKDSNWRDFIS